MKPDFKKLPFDQRNLAEYWFDKGVIEGRKAQVKVDLGIANSFNHGDHNGENFQKCCAVDVAKAIESQEIKP